MRLDHKTVLTTTLLAIFVLASLSFPEAHASTVVEKFPTSTSTIVTGWSEPTFAYTDDGSYAETITDGAWESWEDFGFNFNSTDIIETVYLKIERYGWFSEVNAAHDFLVSVYMNTSDGWTLGESYADYYILDALSAINYLNEQIVSVDFTSIVKTYGNGTFLNDLKISVQLSFSGNDFHYYVDFVSVEVAYTTSTDTGAAAGPGTPSQEGGSWLNLPTLDQFLSGIQQDVNSFGQTLSFAWSNVRDSDNFKVLIIGGLIGVLALLIRLGHSKKKPRRVNQD